MAEQFMTRRERREAERRAAAAGAVQTESSPQQGDPARTEAPTQQPSTQQAPPAARAESASSAPTPQSEIPAFEDTPFEPDRHERGPLASDHPQREAAPRDAASSVNLRNLPGGTGRPGVGADDIPHFATRAERKRYLREHGLEPPPVDAEDGPSSGEQDAEPAREDGEPRNGPGAAPEHSSAASAPAAPPAAPSPAPPPASAEEPVPVRPDAPARDTAGHDLTARRQAAARPQISTATASAADPAGLDFGGPDDSAANGAAASRARRTPVVHPPTSQSIRVVTGATSLARTQAAMDAARRAELEEQSGSAGSDSGRDTAGPAARTAPSGSAKTGGTQTGAGARPATSTDEEPIVSRPAAEHTSDDEQVRRAAAHPPTQPISSVDADEDGESDGLVWDLPNAEVGEEIENPPASPLSARNVTGQDGDILIGERPSKVPYVLLGVSAAIALVLVVIALLLIF